MQEAGRGKGPLPVGAQPPPARADGRECAVRHDLFHTLIKVAGRQAAYLLLRLVVLYYTLARRSGRRRSLQYLGRRFPRRNQALRVWDCYQLNLGIGRVLVDRAVHGLLGSPGGGLALSGRQQLEELLAEGRGLVLLTAHVGCWQLAIGSLGCLATRINLLMHSEEQAGQPAGGKVSYRVIDPAGSLGGALEMLRVLKEGEVVCIMGDQEREAEQGTVSAEFLGAPAGFRSAPYKLASASGAPLAVVFPFRSEKGVHALQLARVIRVPRQLGRSPAAYRPYAAQFAAALEEFVADHPYQFFNSFPMWESASPAEGGDQTGQPTAATRAT